MIKSWLSKLTSPAVAAAVLALAISPAVGLANTPAKAKRAYRHIEHQPVHQSVQFQRETPAQAWDDNDGFYTPPRSPGFHDDFGS